MNATEQHKNTRFFWQIVLGFVVLLVLILVALAAIYFLIQNVGIQASILWTTLIGGLGWLIKANYDRKQEHQRLLADQKRQQYFEFLRILSQFLPIGEVQEGSAPADDDANAEGKRKVSIEEFRMWSLLLPMVGSDEVVHAWSRARGSKANSKTSAPSPETLILFRVWANLLLAMRRDCGHHDTKLTRTDILGSFINDVELYREALDAD